MRERIVPWFRAASRMQVMFLSVSTPWTRADSSRLLMSRSSFSNRCSFSAISLFVFARSRSTSRSISCCCSSIGSSLFWYSFLAFSKFTRITSVNASSPWATTSHRSPSGITSPSRSVSRRLTSSWSMILRAVRSRCRALDTATSAWISAGLNG